MKDNYLKEFPKVCKVYMTARGDKDESRANAQLIATAPEMLEALIDVCIDFEVLRYANIPPVHFKRIKSIEKATNKSWDEIKELIK